MISRRPSNPNLPSVPKLSKLLAPTRLCRTFVFFNLPDSAITHSINQYQLVPSQLLPKHQIAFSQICLWWEKVLANVHLKDVTIERVRVEEFEESLCKDCGWVNLVFLYGFSLKILSESSLYFVGIRGIYTSMRMECKESVFQNRVG